jgi:hypothetical protein
MIGFLGHVIGIGAVIGVAIERRLRESHTAHSGVHLKYVREFIFNLTQYLPRKLTFSAMGRTAN